MGVRVSALENEDEEDDEDRRGLDLEFFQFLVRAIFFKARVMSHVAQQALTGKTTTKM